MSDTFILEASVSVLELTRVLGCFRAISIIGLSDGLTVPFALTAGLSSLGSSKLVYMGGLAEIVSLT